MSRPVRSTRTLPITDDLDIYDPPDLFKKVKKLRFDEGGVFGVRAFHGNTDMGDHAVYIKMKANNTAEIYDQNRVDTLLIHIINYFASRGWTLKYVDYPDEIPLACFQPYGCNRFATWLHQRKF